MDEGAASLLAELDALGIKAICGFVQDKYAGVADQGRCKGQALAHAEGKTTHLATGCFGQAHESQNFIGPGRWECCRIGNNPKVTAGGAPRVKPTGFKCCTDNGRRMR